MIIQRASHQDRIRRQRDTSGTHDVVVGQGDEKYEEHGNAVYLPWTIDEAYDWTKNPHSEGIGRLALILIRYFVSTGNMTADTTSSL
jgi:hypothetical protein